MPFPGAPDRYPGRDEVAGYLERYASWLGAEIQTSTRVQTIRQDGRHFIVVTKDGRALRASGIVAASGSFSNPYRPGFEGEEAFAGELTTGEGPDSRANRWFCVGSYQYGVIFYHCRPRRPTMRPSCRPALRQDGTAAGSAGQRTRSWPG